MIQRSTAQRARHGRWIERLYVEILLPPAPAPAVRRPLFLSRQDEIFHVPQTQAYCQGDYGEHLRCVSVVVVLLL